MSLTPKQIRNGSILYHAMMKRNDGMFTMEKFYHPCGTPACAYGTASTIPELIAQRITREDLCLNDADIRKCFGSKGGAFDELFAGGLAYDIHTPQDWCAHYAKWLKGHGHEVMTEAEIAMGEAAQLGLSQGAGNKACASPVQPSPAPDDGFAAFCAKLLEPVEVK